MKNIKFLFGVLLIALSVNLTSCSKEELNYYVEFYDNNDNSINNDTIAVSINTAYFAKVSIQAQAGTNPQYFIDSDNISGSSEISLKSETFGEVYSQNSELNIDLNDTDYELDEVVEVRVLYSTKNGNSDESFYLKIQ